MATNPPGWQAAPTQTAESILQDMDLSVRARKAIANDPLLAKQDLGINVHNRVATIWGTASDTASRQLAEEQVRSVFGLAEIRNEVHVDSQGKTGRERLPTLSLRSPFAEPAVREIPKSQQTVARRADENGFVSAQEALWRPVAPKTPGKAASESLEPVSSAWAPRPGGSEKPAMPLVSLPSSPTRYVQPAPGQGAPTTDEQKNTSLSNAVEALRLNDSRFQRVRPEVRGGVVYLRGTVYRWEHLHELARSVANVRGVEGVILDDVHAETDQ